MIEFDRNDDGSIYISPEARRAAMMRGTDPLDEERRILERDAEIMRRGAISDAKFAAQVQHEQDSRTVPVTEETAAKLLKVLGSAKGLDKRRKFNIRAAINDDAIYQQVINPTTREAWVRRLSEGQALEAIRVGK